MHQFDFSINAHDHLVGTAYLPAVGLENIPVLVYCHGWGGTRVLPKPQSALLQKAIRLKIAVLSFDFFGCGDSGGDFSLASYGRWTQNLEDVVDWTAAQSWANPKSIGCWGVSSGTTPCIRLSESTSKLAFVISTATCLGLFVNMLNGPTKVFIENWEGLRSGGTAQVFGVNFPIGFFDDFIRNAPVYSLDKVKCPVFFLQGGLDNVWRKTDSLIGFETMQRYGLPVKHVLIEDGGHGLDEVPEKSANEVMTWLREIGKISEV
jgi:pimeloyl-ACP methyl ester carboxylesterase